MSYWGHTYLPELWQGSAERELETLEQEDWLEERHRAHLAKGVDDPACYCYPEAEEQATSLRDESEGAEPC